MSKRILAVVAALALMFPSSVSAAKPQPFAWTYSSGGFATHPNACLGEDSYLTEYGRGWVHGTVELDLHFCDSNDVYAGTSICVCSPGGAALIVRTAGKWPLTVTVYAPVADPPRPTVYTGTVVCITDSQPFDNSGSGGYPIAGGDYRIVISGDSRDMYGLVQVGMSYADWIAANCQPLVL